VITPATAAASTPSAIEDGTAVVVYALLGSEAVSLISFRPASNKESKVLS